MQTTQRFKWRRISAVLLAAALIAAGCGDDDSTAGSDVPADGTDAPDTTSGDSGSSETCTAERAGGELRFGQYLEPVGLDPASPYGARGVVGGTEMLAIYDTLLRYNPDTAEYEPHLAESFSSNDDGSEWTVVLREGITFGNGDPLTAQAVKDSTMRHADPALRSAMSRVMVHVESIETPDERTVVYKMKSPFGEFPWFLAVDGGMVVNPNVVAELGQNFALLPKGAGVGPYEPVSFRPGEGVVLEAKDDYWGGPVCIERLTFSLFGDSNITFEAIKAGNLDIALLRDAVTIDAAEKAGYASHVNTYGLGYVLRINAEEGNPGADVRVRRAIAMAINRETHNERVFRGLGTPNGSLVASNSRFAPLEGIEYDPDEAKQLIDEYKAETGWDGSLNLVCGSDGISEATSIAVDAMLTPIGVDINPQLVPDSQARQARKEYQLACSGAAIADSAPWTGLSNFATPRDLTGYSNADYDAAMLDLLSAQDDNARREALVEAQRIWNETMPTVGLGELEEVIAWRDGIEGLRFGTETLTYFGDAYLP